ncbi:MAG: D-aminoacylase [Verrucomicrobia bacterium]|nr:D-aminoacylase [Verrucomicrobiota bacterium]
MEKLDIIFRNARVVDGTGAPWFRADVGVFGDRIAAVGKINEATALEEIDAKGSYLSAGFIDSHTHDDVALLDDPHHAAKLLQGVTTVVVGNCSFSNYPSAGEEETLQHLASLLGEVKPKQMFHDFSSYRSRLNAAGIALNVVSLVGHGPLRLAVMGFARREATRCEIDQMGRLLGQQLQQGAHGLSFGLAYPPSAYAGRRELVRLAEVVNQHDRLLAAHIRSYGGELLESIQEFLDILQASGAKGLLSHLQVAGKPYWGMMPRALELIDQARNEGVDVSVDMYPYPAGSSTILQLLPPSVQEGGIAALLRRLAIGTERERIRQLTESGAETGWESKIALIGWDKVRIGSASHPELKRFEGKTFSEAANLSGLSPFEFTLHAIRLDAGKTNIIMFQLSEEDLRVVHQYRLQMVGSDSIPRHGGKPHPRMFGSFPRVIGRLAMKQRLIPLEEAARRMTSLPAQRFQLLDRGVIRPGLIADLALFSNEFLDRATFEDPQQNPTGLEGLWVNGVRTVKLGEILADLPGRVITRQ